MVDQLRHLESPLLRGNTAMLLSMQRFLAFVIRHQLPKICRHRCGFGGFRRRLGWPDLIRSILAMEKARLKAADGIGESSAFPATVAS
jgi:hypothetical protein